jgi:hypothetical protein
MKNYLEVVDNFIPKAYQEEIKKMVLGSKFPWFFSNEISTSDHNSLTDSAPCHYHIFRSPSQIGPSPGYNFISPMAMLAADHIGIEFNDILVAKSFLQFPLADKFTSRKIDPLHIDMPIDHLICLYYVVDSDGDTIITSYRSDERELSPEHYTKDDILKKITPKQGRAVLFDGRLYHTAEQPKNHVRCIINLNIV